MICTQRINESEAILAQSEPHETEGLTHEFRVGCQWTTHQRRPKKGANPFLPLSEVSCH